MSEQLDAFRKAWLAGTEAFNEHDFDAAFSGLDDDTEWHHMEVWQSMGSSWRGGREVADGYRELIAEFPDWRVEERGFLDLGSGVFAVRARASAHGRSSGAPVAHDFTQVWELDPDAGRVIRVREVEGHPPMSRLVPDPLGLCQATMAAFNARDGDALLDRMDPDVEWWPLRSETEGAFRGHDGIRKWLAETAELFEHSRAEIAEASWEGDDGILAAGRIDLEGKQSGAPIELPVTWVFRVRGDKVVWGRAFSDRESALAELA